jgi:hypothetical protein
LFTLFQTIANAGIKDGNSASEQRGILLCNQINLILFGLGLLLSIFYWIYYPPNIIRYIIPAIGGLGILFIILNALHYNTISRIGTSLFVPFSTMALSLYSKNLYYEQQIDLDYFTFRFIILGASILPAVLFSPLFVNQFYIITCP